MLFKNRLTKRSAVPEKTGLNNRLRLLYILIMLWIGRNTIFMRRRDDYSGLDMLAMIQIGIIMLILALLFLSAMGDFRKQIKSSSLKFYLFYLLLGAGSALWSVNPTYSFYRAMEAFGMSAAILYFCASAVTPEEGIRRVQLIIWPTILAQVAGSILLMGFSLMLRSNGLGASAAMVGCFFVACILADPKNRNRKILIQAGAGLFFVVISMSLASWWSLWLGIIYCSLFTKRKGMVIALVVIGVTLFYAVDQDTRQAILLRDKSQEHLTSMTGRKILWTDYLAASQKRPLLGFGFGMGAREVGAVYTTNTHNAFFAALLGVGWLGVGLLGIFVISLARELLKYKHSWDPVWLACAAAIAAGMLNTMSLSIIGENFIVSTTVFVALLGLHMVFLKQEKQARSEKQNQRKPLLKTRAVFRRR